MTHSRNWQCLALFALLVGALFGGCGKSEATTWNDERHIQQLVENVSESMSKPNTFKEVFTDQAAPAKGAKSKYRERMFVWNKIAIEGESATVKVNVRDKEGKPSGDVEWTAVKQNGKWKLSSVPLP